MRLAMLAALALPALEAKITLTFGVDVNYPPYAYKDPKGNLIGMGKDIAEGMNAICDDIHINVVETRWPNCWDPTDGGKIGKLLDNGELDACMTYTHTKGIRNNYVEFSNGFLMANKPAGLISLLDENGEPAVKGTSDLAGLTVVDVGGWAPTADGLDFVINKCTDKHYSKDYKLVTGPGNDESLKMLFNGQADAMFIYADQGFNFKKACADDEPDAFDCNLWRGFGKRYAYTQTGQFGYVNNGTTVAMAKKGSGVIEKVNPCIQKYMRTKAYMEFCEKWHKMDECYPNTFFDVDHIEKEDHPYFLPTDEHTTGCWDGYCPCTYDANGDGEWDDYDYDLHKRIFRALSNADGSVNNWKVAGTFITVGSVLLAAVALARAALRKGDQSTYSPLVESPLASVA